jgi:proteasome lid subunit RPN8/RPN11
MIPNTTRTSSSSLWIPPALRARIESAAKRGHPQPSCGVLVGAATRDRVVVKHVEDAENLALERPTGCYELDPLALFRAERKARDLGLAVVGIWIGRAAEEARPTRIDLALAWEGWSYVFVATGPEGAHEMRSWRLVGGDFEEELVVAAATHDPQRTSGACPSGTVTSIEPFQ